MRRIIIIHHGQSWNSCSQWWLPFMAFVVGIGVWLVMLVAARESHIDPPSGEEKLVPRWIPNLPGQWGPLHPSMIIMIDWIYCLVGGLGHSLFSHILGIVIPIDSYLLEGFKPPTSYLWDPTSIPLPTFMVESFFIFYGWDLELIFWIRMMCPYVFCSLKASCWNSKVWFVSQFVWHLVSPLMR